jgi:hypothetical protein
LPDSKTTLMVTLMNGRLDRKRRRQQKRPVVDTHGKVALAEWLQSPAHTQGRLAELLEVEQPLVSQWLKGVARPSPPLREALDIVCGIPADSWLSAKERALVDRVRHGSVPARRAS